MPDHVVTPWPVGSPLARLLRRRAQDRAADRDDHLDPGELSDWIAATEVSGTAYVATLRHPLVDREVLADLAAASRLGWRSEISTEPGGQLTVTFVREPRPGPAPPPDLWVS